MRYSLNVLSAVFFLGLCMLSGCGGGGGGGSAGGGVTPPPDPNVYVGTTAFDPDTSRALASNAKGFDIPATWTFRSGPPGGASIALDSDQTFELSSVTVSGVSLPCFRVKYVDTVDPAGCLYEWWAVGVDGALYRITRGRYDFLPGADDGFRNNSATAPVLLSQARLIIPASLAMGTAWTSGASATLNVTNSSDGHYATHTVVGVGLTSPHGFPGCVRVRVETSTETWFEWWMGDRGLVEVEVEDPSDPTYNFRSDFSTSG